MNLAEADVQVLIAVLNLGDEQRLATHDNLTAAQDYFRRSLVDWSDRFDPLMARGLLVRERAAFTLTEQGRELAARLRRARPAMWYWYADYYTATRTSKAYATFCERVFGRNFAQHGFSDMAQIEIMLRRLRLSSGSRALELGCGNGAMAAHIAAATGARVTGIDYSPQAIGAARTRRNARLDFCVMDIGALAFAPQSFDALISVDTLYFTDIGPTVQQMRWLLAPGGQMGVFYAHGVSPETPREAFRPETLAADKTPLGEALTKAGLRFDAIDMTAADYDHARLKKTVMEELRPALEAEGNLFLYTNRHGEAKGVMAAIEDGLHARYLYHIVV